MDFYLKDESGKTIAVLEYIHGTKTCVDCNEIVIKKGSLMSKQTYCINKWYDCKWIEDARNEAIFNEMVAEHDDEYYIFTKDVVFKSPIKAASVVLGHIEQNSWDLITDDSGHTLRETYRK